MLTDVPVLCHLTNAFSTHDTRTITFAAQVNGTIIQLDRLGLRHNMQSAFDLAEGVANELSSIGFALVGIPKLQDATVQSETLREYIRIAREEKKRADELMKQVQSMADEKEALARQLDVMQEIQETTKRDMDKVGG